MSRFTMSIFIALGGALVVETVFLIWLVVKRRHKSRETPQTESHETAVPTGSVQQRGGEPFLKSIATSVVSGVILFLITAALTGSFTKPSTPQAPGETVQTSTASDNSHLDTGAAADTEPNTGTLEEPAIENSTPLTAETHETQPLDDVLDSPEIEEVALRPEDPEQPLNDDEDTQSAQSPSEDDPVATENPEDTGEIPAPSIETSAATTARLEIPLIAPECGSIPPDVSASRILVEGAAASTTIKLQAGSAPAAEARVRIDGASSTAVISLGDGSTLAGAISPRVLVQGAATTLLLDLESPELEAMAVSKPRVRVEGVETTKLLDLVAPPPAGEGE